MYISQAPGFPKPPQFWSVTASKPNSDSTFVGLKVSKYQPFPQNFPKRFQLYKTSRSKSACWTNRLTWQEKTHKSDTTKTNPRMIYPIWFMYGTSTYIWPKFMVNVGKYSIPMDPSWVLCYIAMISAYIFNESWFLPTVQLSTFPIPPQGPAQRDQPSLLIKLWQPGNWYRSFLPWAPNTMEKYRYRPKNQVIYHKNL